MILQTLLFKNDSFDFKIRCLNLFGSKVFDLGGNLKAQNIDKTQSLRPNVVFNKLSTVFQSMFIIRVSVWA